MFKKQQARASTILKALLGSGSNTAQQRLDESRQELMAQFPVNMKTTAQRRGSSK